MTDNKPECIIEPEPTGCVHTIGNCFIVVGSATMWYFLSYFYFVMIILVVVTGLSFIGKFIPGGGSKS